MISVGYTYGLLDNLGKPLGPDSELIFEKGEKVYYKQRRLFRESAHAEALFLAKTKRNET